MVEKLREILEMIEDVESDSVYDLACQVEEILREKGIKARVDENGEEIIIRTEGKKYRLPIAVSYTLIPSMLEEDE